MSITDLVPWSWWKRPKPYKAGEEHPLASFQREMNRLFEDFFSHSLAPSPFFEESGLLPGTFTPKIDMRETDKEILLSAELPGLNEKDFDLTLDKDTLTIRGEKKEEAEEKGKGFYSVERRFGSFQRTIPLPVEVIPEKAKATYEKGVLKIALPKTEKAQSERIKIKVTKG